MGAPKRTMRFQAGCLIALVGCAGWLYATLGGFSDEVTCVIDGIKDLKTVQGTVGEVTTEAANAIPADVMDPLETAVPLIAVGAILPAAVLVLLQACLLHCAKKGGGCCIKCMMLLFSLFILIGIGFYAAIGVGGMVAGGDTAARDTLEDVCEEFIPEIQAILADKESELQQASAQAENCPQGNPQCAQFEQDRAAAQFEIDQGQKAMNIMATMCDCMVAIFDELANFTGPGLACAFFCFCLFILNCCACCCIGRAKKGADVEKTVANV